MPLVAEREEHVLRVALLSPLPVSLVALAVAALVQRRQRRPHPCRGSAEVAPARQLVAALQAWRPQLLVMRIAISHCLTVVRVTQIPGLQRQRGQRRS